MDGCEGYRDCTLNRTHCKNLFIFLLLLTDLAFAFVFRDVSRSTPTMEGAAAKRKAGIFIYFNVSLNFFMS